MSTIKPVEKIQTKSYADILTHFNQEYQSNSIFKENFEIQIIAALYLIFKMFRKIKFNFDINLRISRRNNELKH
ncbi:hypothetical protein [Chryseobacterium gambrini]|uniref:Uncharacterized protein n=1 Tax=Chryseobacterium gambrini TaxID=373672 RepID=A0ABN7C926_9FLAO|nr:hypothetical protein CRDW_01940 [Chryseobacterium gambrini]